MTAPEPGSNAAPGRSGQGWLWFFAYGIVPLLSGWCVITGTFHEEGWYPVDAGDEAAETFVQLPMVQDQLAAGHLLKINLFNNFGTPILGEPVVCPFAVHAWTYFFFRPIIAMMVNKFVLATLSVAVLTVFYSRYFPLLIGSLCALLTFSSPVFFYFFQNHPHQGVLLYYPLILLAIRSFFDHPTTVRGLWLYAAFLVFFLSVGVNGALLGTGFIFAYAILLAGSRWRLLAWGLALWLVAFVAVYPHYFEFFRLAAQSARKDLDYQNLTAVARLEFLKGLVIHRAGALQTDIFYSSPVVALLVAGLALLASRIYPRQFLTNRLSLLLLALGVLPLLTVICFRLVPGLAAMVPLFKAVNASRILWFSDLFLMLAVGVAVNTLYQELKRRPLGFRLFWLALLVVGLVPRYQVFRHQAGFFRLHESMTQFCPIELLGYLQRYTRLATLEDPVGFSQDTKVNRAGVLGSAGRSIILQKAFRDHLMKLGLIRAGFHGMTYYFQPAPSEILARFGIRYCLAEPPDPRLSKMGWNLLAEALTTPTQFLFALYENPTPVTPFYIRTETQLEFLDRYLLNGNQMEVVLPPREAPYDVVATFLARPGWKAFINGQRVPIETSADLLMQVQVPPSSLSGDLLLRYEPYTTAWLLACGVFSLVAGGTLCRLAGRHTSPRRQ